MHSQQEVDILKAVTIYNRYFWMNQKHLGHWKFMLSKHDEDFIQVASLNIMYNVFVTMTKWESKIGFDTLQLLVY